MCADIAGVAADARAVVAGSTTVATSATSRRESFLIGDITVPLVVWSVKIFPPGYGQVVGAERVPLYSSFVSRSY